MPVTTHFGAQKSTLLTLVAGALLALLWLPPSYAEDEEGEVTPFENDVR